MMAPVQIRTARTSTATALCDGSSCGRIRYAVPCREHGYTVAAVEIDHIEPVTRAPERFWDETDWQPICRSCHEDKSARELRRRRGATVEGDLA